MSKCCSPLTGEAIPGNCCGPDRRRKTGEAPAPRRNSGGEEVWRIRALRFYDIQGSTCWMSPELVIPKPSGRIYCFEETKKEVSLATLKEHYRPCSSECCARESFKSLRSEIRYLIDSVWRHAFPLTFRYAGVVSGEKQEMGKANE
ncbi:hypothetical protein CEXT_289541 [Caerostris extrusa]|uniref:Uncharacterized protein n=1 Tax=Caerostris extrusa TaxID=172846 RepID=A0AAV4WG52_CAEEX|nr:hypothetical protein CEXT_289541 [Caerostris extrusa]